jgi:hypothetical protein
MHEWQVSDWSDFLRKADTLDTGPIGPRLSTHVYRGYPNAEWRLTTSLQRMLEVVNVADETRALQLEAISLQEFKAQALHHVSPNVLTSTNDTISWWSLMQHHGAPTRLLDWTSSIFVAAYFACSGHPNADGAIRVVHVWSMDDWMDKKYHVNSPPENENEIKDRYLTAGAPHHVYFLSRESKTDRMIAQQGLFSICQNILGDYETIFGDVFNDQSLPYYIHIRIPAKFKPLFRRKLRAMNIVANSLFPGLDGVGRSVAELIEAAEVTV